MRQYPPKSPKQSECLILWVGWTRSRPRPKYPDIFLYPFGNPACNMCRWFKSIPLGSVYDSVFVSFFPSLCGGKYDMGVRMEIAFDRKWYAAWKIQKLSVCWLCPKLLNSGKGDPRTPGFDWIGSGEMRLLELVLCESGKSTLLDP